MNTSSRFYSLAYSLVLLANPIIGLSQSAPTQQPVYVTETQRQVATGSVRSLPMQQLVHQNSEGGRPSQPRSAPRPQTVCPSLIVNGDFEKMNVPTLTYASNVKNPSSNLDELADWRATNYATPDYYNYNSSSALVYPPTAYLVPFSPRNNSQGSVGIYGQSDYQEYIYQQIQPLRASKRYYAEFFALESFSVGAQLGMNVTSTNPLTTQPNVVYSAVPTGILSPATQSISHTDWTRVSGQFTAQGGESHVNIGYMAPLPTSGNYNYYIDDVALYEIPTAGPNQACPGASSGVTIGEGCSIPGAKYSWSPSTDLLSPTSLNTKATPTTTTIYTLTVTLPDNTTYATATTVTACPPCLAPPTPNFGIVAVPNTVNSSQIYDVAVSNGSDTNYFTLQLTDPTPPYIQSGYTYTQSLYTGASTSTPPIEAQGFTTFHTGLIGPHPNTGPGVTYRMLVTAYSPCGSTTATQIITLPANGGSGEDPYRTTPGASTTAAYPNPVSETLNLPQDIKKATLFNSKGKAVQQSTERGTLDIKALPAGLYNLQMQQSGKVINQRIEIKH